MTISDSEAAASNERAMELAARLHSVALGSVSTRGEAATALMTAAAAILVEDFGTFAGIELLQSSLDEAAAVCRASRH